MQLCNVFAQSLCDVHVCVFQRLQTFHRDLHDPIKTAQHTRSTTFIPLDTEVYEPFDT